jgi:hypothetical protein
MIKIKLCLTSLIALVWLGSCVDKTNPNSSKLIYLDTIPEVQRSAKTKNYTNLMPIYLDSIKDFEHTGVIPDFFQDHDLDLKYGMHSLYNVHSFRKALFHSIESTSLLQAIIDSKSNIYKKKPTKSRGKYQYPDLSTYEMALIRLQFIQEKNEKR